jgi:class 3 adenylate cyclase
LGFDPARIGKDILRAIRELEGAVNDTALGTESSKANQVPEKTASAPAIPQGVAILMFTDIAGFTSYVEKNGDEAGHSMLKLHNHIIRTSVKNNGGIEIKNLGDGFMLCFVSAKKALQCAADIQEQLREAEYQLQVRVGIHAGEPIHEDKDLTGQTVNLAARVMDQANGGQIFVTEVIRNLAGNLSGFQYADQGERRLPGLSERHKIYEFVPIEALTSPLDTEVEGQLSKMEKQLHQDA